MDVAVILCTHNRCQSLRKALESVAMSQVPAAWQWQVLVVDNNSTDQTPQVAHEFCQRDPDHFRYVFESRQGKSNALNRGIREVQAHILAFMDDDVIVETDWLRNLVEPLSDPQWSGTGGRIYLPKTFSPPSWMALEGQYSLGGILALFDLGSDAGPLSIPPIGTNMAFRKEMFLKYGNFRTDLGPSPGSEIRYEDTEFGWRLLRGGEKLQYVPSAVVRHAVAERRLHKEYYLAYYFDYGRALVRERGDRSGIGFVPRPIVSLSNRLLNILPKRIWRWLKETDPRKRFFNKCQVWNIVGEITEICQRALSSNSQQHNCQPQTAKQ
jgi:glycosyltransferase involved in cell wall biosynthesis